MHALCVRTCNVVLSINGFSAMRKNTFKAENLVLNNFPESELNFHTHVIDILLCAFKIITSYHNLHLIFTFNYIQHLVYCRCCLTHFRRNTDSSVFCTVANRLELRSGPTHMPVCLLDLTVWEKDCQNIFFQVDAGGFFMVAILFARLQWVKTLYTFCRFDHIVHDFDLRMCVVISDFRLQTMCTTCRLQLLQPACPCHHRL